MHTTSKEVLAHAIATHNHSNNCSYDCPQHSFAAAGVALPPPGRLCRPTEDRIRFRQKQRLRARARATSERGDDDGCAHGSCIIASVPVPSRRPTFDTGIANAACDMGDSEEGEEVAHADGGGTQEQMRCVRAGASC